MTVPAILFVESVKPLSFRGKPGASTFSNRWSGPSSRPGLRPLRRASSSGARPRGAPRAHRGERRDGRARSERPRQRRAGGPPGRNRSKGSYVSDRIPDDVKSILATDCGSTTTKAILIERRGDEYRLIVRGEAPDHRRGAVRGRHARRAQRGLRGRGAVRPQAPRTARRSSPRRRATEGVDIYISTSRAGGGLQMMVAGVVKTMTAESAERAALGAGAIVMDVIAVERRPAARTRRSSASAQLRPDMILLSGGIDGGTVDARGRDGRAHRGRRPASPASAPGTSCRSSTPATRTRASRSSRTLDGQERALAIVDNLRPVLERENLRPARDAIHDLFMEHVMAQAPGLQQADDVDRRADHAHAGRGRATSSQTIAQDGEHQRPRRRHRRRHDRRLLASFQTAVFNRTVSANLGHALLDLATCWPRPALPNILRWVPFEIDERRPAEPDQEQDDPPDDDPADARGAEDRAGDRPRGAAARVRSSTRRSPSGSRACSRSGRSPTPSSRRRRGETLVDMMDARPARRHRRRALATRRAARRRR